MAELAHKNIPYARAPGVEVGLTSLDIYLPVGESNGPVVAYFHGGGWKEGDKSRVGGLPETLNQGGCTFVSANYRLSPGAKFPTHAEDVAGVVAWLEAHLADHTPWKRLFLMGSSAGAHLVSLVAADPRYLEDRGLSTGILSGVVSLDTRAYDIPHLMEGMPRGGRRLYVETFGDNPASWYDASPINHVLPGRQLPPFLVGYTFQDPLRKDESERFADRLREAGCSATLLPMPDRRHADIVQKFGANGDLVAPTVLEFVGALEGDWRQRGTEEPQ